MWNSSENGQDVASLLRCFCGILYCLCFRLSVVADYGRFHMTRLFTLAVTTPNPQTSERHTPPVIYFS
eukprot:s3077_g7.t1